MKMIQNIILSWHLSRHTFLKITLVITLVVVGRFYTYSLSRYLPHHCCLPHYFRLSLAYRNDFLLSLISIPLLYLPLPIYFQYKILHLLAHHLIK